MMKNDFYLIFKALFVLKIINKILTFWSCTKINCKKVNCKTYEAKPGQKTIAKHILTNISRSQGNQAVKIAQLIEYNM